jgi:hypothetical protein
LSNFLIKGIFREGSLAVVGSLDAPETLAPMLSALALSSKRVATFMLPARLRAGASGESGESGVTGDKTMLRLVRRDELPVLRGIEKGSAIESPLDERAVDCVVAAAGPDRFIRSVSVGASALRVPRAKGMCTAADDAVAEFGERTFAL